MPDEEPTKPTEPEEAEATEPEKEAEEEEAEEAEAEETEEEPQSWRADVEARLNHIESQLKQRKPKANPQKPAPEQEPIEPPKSSRKHRHQRRILGRVMKSRSK